MLKQKDIRSYILATELCQKHQATRVEYIGIDRNNYTRLGRRENGGESAHKQKQQLHLHLHKFL